MITGGGSELSTRRCSCTTFAMPGRSAPSPKCPPLHWRPSAWATPSRCITALTTVGWIRPTLLPSLQPWLADARETELITTAKRALAGFIGFKQYRSTFILYILFCINSIYLSFIRGQEFQAILINHQPYQQDT